MCAHGWWQNMVGAGQWIERGRKAGKDEAKWKERIWAFSSLESFSSSWVSWKPSRGYHNLAESLLLNEISGNRAV